MSHSHVPRVMTDLSLRWKAFLVLFTVLAVVHGGLAYNGYLDLHQQHEQQAIADFAKYRATLGGLIEQAQHDVEEQARALAAVASIEELSWTGELYFAFTAVRYYSADGRGLAEWRLSGTDRDQARADRERSQAPAVAKSARPLVLVECEAACVLHGLVPAFERGGREIVVAATFPLDGLLAAFRRLAGADLALAVPGPASQGPALWGRRLAALTDTTRLPSLLGAITATEPRLPGQHIVPAGARNLRVAVEPLPIATHGGVQALIFSDQTERIDAIRADVRNYLTLTLFGMVIATAAIFILLTPSLRRLGLITQGLPLLAAQRFADARRLFARAARGGGLGDEIDRLNDSAVTLANRLEKLMGAEAASEAKSQFLAAMSHEIRTPINGVLGLLELHEETELSDSQRESVRIMRDSAMTLLAVVDDILDFSKIEAGQLSVDPAPMSLREAVEGALETLAATAASKGLRLMCHVDPGVPAQVQADAIRLRQVLLNLCSNAIKFTARGHVSVVLDARAAVAGRVGVRCVVRDTGIGIVPAARERLFKPFSQAEASTTRSYGGTGLGLSISRGLIERMGGRMGFDSAVGEGSEFWFEIECPVVEATAPAPPSLDGIAVHVDVPDVHERLRLQRYFESAGARAQGDAGGWRLRLEELGHTGFRLVTDDGHQQAIGRPVRYLLLLREAALLCGRVGRAPAEAPAPRALAPAFARGRLLVAEDHPTNRRVIRQQLERLGFDADIVEDGHQALERIALAPYALLITDLHMPGLDGIALTAEVRRREAAESRAPLPVIGLTADVLPASVDRCRAAGMTDVLRKPVSMAELGRTLARWLPSQPAGPPIDRRELARVMGTDDEAMLRETLEDFLRVSLEQMNVLLDAVRRADGEGVQRIAHRLSGSARTIGAGDLAHAATALEQAARQGRAADLAELHGALCMDFERVRGAIAPLRSAAA